MEWNEEHSHETLACGDCRTKGLYSIFSRTEERGGLEFGGNGMESEKFFLLIEPL